MGRSRLRTLHPIEPGCSCNRVFPSALTGQETLAQIERLTDHIRKYGYGFFAVERKDNHEFIGFTGLSNPGFEVYFTPCIEIGWRLSRANWGHGFATEAAGACLDFGFNVLNDNEIYAFTATDNIRSERVMIKLGMTRQGTFEHPLIEDGHPLKKHLLYKIIRPELEMY